MYLRQVDMHGFKSFADKNELFFLEGINAVVGPNGSGKSNISDAIRWVLGEQSAKSLRAGKMEDVIFSGTEKRKQLGFAEVSLYIDNTDKRIPVDFSEINITRRMFRSGESEYYMNKVQCRMKDIHELFMDTGIGREGYSIIGQGRIDEILSNRSEDRRQIFEEAAGIVKYRARKEAAEKKLEQTKNNILRVQDIIAEIEAQIEPLKDQAEIAKKYRVIIEELKELEVNLLIYHIEKSREKIESVLKNIQSMEELLLVKTREVEQIERQIVALKEQMNQSNLMITRAVEDTHHKKSEKQRIQGDLELRKERKNSINESIELYHKQIDDHEEELGVLTQRHENQDLEYIELIDLLKKHKVDLEETEKTYYNKHQLLYELEESERSKQQEIMDLIDDLMEHKSRFIAAESFFENIGTRKQQLADEVELLKSDIATKYSDAELVGAELKEFSQQIESQNMTLEELQLKKNDLEKTISTIERGVNDLNNNRGAILSRLKVLEELENEHSGYSKPVKTMLQDMGTIKRIATGFHGVLGDLISVPDQYVTAIEIALGAAIQNIVTETEHDAKNLIEHLKRKRIGRATFLPIASVKPRSLSEGERKRIDQKGVIGVASELINCNTKYKNIMASLLGRVIIIDHIENAIATAKATNYDYKIVTLDGEVMNAGGSMTGGSTGGNNYSVLSRKNEINALKVKLAVSKEELEEKSEELETVKEEFFDLGRSISEQSREVQKLNMEYHSMINKKANIEQDMQRLKHRITTINSEIVVLDSDEISSKDEMKVHKQKQNETETIKHKLEKQQIQLQLKINEQKAKNAEDTKVMTQQKLNIATTEQKIIALEKEQRQLLQNIKAIQHRQEKSGGEIKELQNEMIQCNAIMAELTIKIEESSGKILEAEVDLKHREEEYVQLKSTGDVLEQKSKQLQIEINTLQNNQYKEDAQKLKLEMELENYETKLLDSYELTYYNALGLKKEDLSIPQANKRCNEVKEEIRGMGSVNVNAVEEYDKLTERYTFLTQQVNDLLKAKESIAKIIHDIVQTMKQQFITEFRKINEKFGEAFVDLFGGGNAELVITDESNILESGIDIIARPPGKKMQSLSLLSGGERALTAIALLFGILKLKPSPFCVLDEIDAALDDANVDRYANYLNKFAETTQFIIITHRKGSMGVANSLYGVSMQDSGVSKMLSVKFDDGKE